MSYRWAAPVVLSILLLASGCLGVDYPASSEIANLRGKTIGVVSLSDVAALEARYLLQEGYGLDISQGTGAVKFVELPFESLVSELQSGQIDAAVVNQAAAFRLASDQRFRVLSHVSEETRRLAGGPVATSALVTYPDVAAEKPAALDALNRLLAQSVAYYRANQGQVQEAVAQQQGEDPGFLGWQADRQDLRLGDLSEPTRERLLRTWQLATALGDLDRLPDPDTVLFDAGRQKSPAGLDGGRLTISLALLDDPSRRAALYAVEQGIVTSDNIDVNITYLPASALAEAATTRQYDVIEAQPLIIPLSARQDLGFVVLCAGAEDLDATLLVVRSEAEAP